jgi:hypothetical protein
MTSRLLIFFDAAQLPDPKGQHTTENQQTF